MTHYPVDTSGRPTPLPTHTGAYFSQALDREQPYTYLLPYGYDPKTRVSSAGAAAWYA